MKIFLLVTVFALSVLGLLGSGQTAYAAGGIPPWPVLYSGSVTLGGCPEPDGLWIVGRMDGYTSVALEIKDGRMSGLAVGAPDQTFFPSTSRHDPPGTRHHPTRTVSGCAGTVPESVWIVPGSFRIVPAQCLKIP